MSGAAVGGLIDVCEGYVIYDETHEPDLSKPAKVREYADGLVRLTAAIDPKLKVSGTEVPRALADELRQLHQAATSLLSGVTTGDGGHAREALGTFANDPAVRQADLDFRRFDETVCALHRPSQ